MDLTLDVDDYKLNIRAAGVIIHNNKFLVHNSSHSEHCALIGGRVRIGEDSATTCKREVKEEIGKDVEEIGYIGTVENFFEMKGKKYHEILFIHQLEFTNEDDKKIDYSLKNIEGEDHLSYDWVDLDKADAYNVLPKSAVKIIKEGKYPAHAINKD